MKYTEKTALEEVMRRRDILIQKRRCEKMQRIAGLSAGLTILLCSLILVLPPRRDVTAVQAVYGAFLFPVEKGGYVIVSLIAFVLGITVAVFCMKSQEKNDVEKKKEKEEK